MSILIKNVVVNGEEKDIFVEGNKISKIADNIQIETEHQIDGINMVALSPISFFITYNHNYFLNAFQFKIRINR